MKRNLVGIIAGMLIIAPGMAQAQAPCLTPSEVSSLVSYAMPSVIVGTTKRCAASLAPNAYLRTDGAGLAARYAMGKDGAWPGAKAAFLKIGGKDDSNGAELFRKMPDKVQRDMLDVIISGMISQEIGLDKCPVIDSFARLIAPLPPENTAELAALVASLAGKPKDNDRPAQSGIPGKLPICGA